MKAQILNTFEIIVAKGEIAKKEQFLVFPQYFLKSSAAEASGIVGKGFGHEMHISSSV